MVSITQVDQFTSILVIEKLSSEHNGNYTCVVSNLAAEVSHTHQLVVNGNWARRVACFNIYFLSLMFVSLLSQFLLLLSPFPFKTGCQKACELVPSAAWVLGIRRWWFPGSRMGNRWRLPWASTCRPLIPILVSSAFLVLTRAILETSLAWQATLRLRSGTPPSYRSKVTTQPVSFHPSLLTTIFVALAHASTGIPRSRYCCTRFCSFSLSQSRQKCLKVFY